MDIGNKTILLYARKSEQPTEIVHALNDMIIYMKEQSEKPFV